MTPYSIGFDYGYNDALGIVLRQTHAPYPEHSDDLDSYVSGYYDGFLKGSEALSHPN